MILPAIVCMGQVCGRLPANAQLVTRLVLSRPPRRAPYLAVVFHWPDAIGQPEGAWYAIGVGESYPRVTLACESEERARMAARAQRWVTSRRLTFVQYNNGRTPLRTSISIPWRMAHAAGLVHG